jgi:hypothetical protein
MVLTNCAEETTTLSSFNGAVDAYHQYWSSTIKGDTVIYECAQTLKVNYGQRDLVLRPRATVKVYPQKDTIVFDNFQDLKPELVSSSINRETKGLNPIVHSFRKEFTFNDTEVICADVSYEVYSLENEVSTYAMPSMSVTDIEFVEATVVSDELNENELRVELDFRFYWQVENLSQSGSNDLTIEYLKLSSIVIEDDELEETSFNTGYNFINENQLEFFIEKVEKWKYKGVKKDKHTSIPLSINFEGEPNTTQKVSNFNFTSSLHASSISNDLSKDNWFITENLIEQKISYSNQVETFEDVFTYRTYEVACFVWNKTFEFDLNVDFKSSNELVKINDVSAKLITSATLSIASKSFNKEKQTILELKNTNPDDNPPLYGKIISHNISAVFDVTDNTTKKAVIVHYEHGYEWGICEYNEAFPAIFTYTQSSYSGFNSVAKRGSDAAFRLARSVDTDSIIFWYSEDNTLLSAIDALTCRVIGWKNIVDGKYSSKMDDYKQDFIDNNYILVLTSPNGETKTFSSYELK